MERTEGICRQAAKASKHSMPTDPWSLPNIASHPDGTRDIPPTTNNPAAAEMPELRPTNHDNQASKILDDRSEQGQDYTILSDSTAAVTRVQSDSTGPGQRFAIAVAEVCSRLSSRENTLTLRWVPSHSDIEGNEVADDWAKMAAESPMDAVPRDYLCETSFAYMSGKATEARSAGVAKWIVDHVKKKHRCPPRRG